MTIVSETLLVMYITYFAQLNNKSYTKLLSAYSAKLKHHGYYISMQMIAIVINHCV